MEQLIASLVTALGPAVLISIVVLVLLVPAAVRVLPDWERAIILRFGKFNRVTGPGIVWLIPYIDRPIRVDTRIVTFDVPRQEMMTRDNVPVTVDAIVLFRVVEPKHAILEIENFSRTTSLIAQTTLRAIIGQVELDELLASRDRINQRLQTVIDEQTEPYGVKVQTVEVRDVILPDSLKRAMAAQAESERERRAKVINAQGEFDAAEKLTQAAALIGREPAALQLRYMQSIREIASERSTIMILPVPIDILKPFVELASRINAPEPPASRAPGA
ncbi:MAG TPA: slipin family protein [Chthonomonadales bacterium]|nr:slipin family protein [Chthonomonadales bacterium]